MSKYEMIELARKMERYPEQFSIMGEPDYSRNVEPEVVAEGIEADSREWWLIIDALKIASSNGESKHG